LPPEHHEITLTRQEREEPIRRTDGHRGVAVSTMATPTAKGHVLHDHD
jgi:hypothetical protein